MNIGMTYDLRADYLAAGYGEEETAEFDRPDTIAAIEGALQAQGHQTDRIGNVDSLVRRLAAGQRWDLVFNIAEGLYGFGREAVVPALLDAYRIPYTFSDPLMMTVTLHKATAKRVVRDLGIATPDFALLRSLAEVAAVNLPYPLFAKPVAEGTGKGVTPVSKIAAPAQLRAVCADLLAAYCQPVLVETFLPGREFTVGIVGNGHQARSIGIIEVILLENSEPDVYSYRNKEICEEVVEYRVPDDPEAHEAVRVALEVWHGLDCRDAGRVDLRSDRHGRPNFIEINPIAGLHPEHSDLCIIAGKHGMGYRQLISEIVDAALERVGMCGKP
ncbi:MAG: D-alanine--D-alanine ligase [Desulfurivibrionaceae bacterium]|nr:D-alanine--D-alanine ligase [Desulfurivibrionaceae bacterium]